MNSLQFEPSPLPGNISIHKAENIPAIKQIRFFLIITFVALPLMTFLTPSMRLFIICVGLLMLALASFYFSKLLCRGRTFSLFVSDFIVTILVIAYGQEIKQTNQNTEESYANA